jgi:uncharacterized protein with FMN-binding domain
MYPKRAFVAIAATGVALALLLSFKTPDATFTRAGGGTAVVPADGHAAASPPGNGTGSGGGTGGSSGSSGSTSGGGSSGGGSSGGGSPGRSPGGTPGGTSGGSAGTASGTLTGSLVRTRYGDVQVQITLKNGKITAVTALQLPSGGRSGYISQAVEPILHDETLQVQSAQIDLVSGATYTSTGYAQSLQAALDQAHS